MADGRQDGSEIGPLIDIAAVEKVEEHIGDAVKNGAKIIAGGKKHTLGGQFFEPTVMTNVSKKMKIFAEETFGPVFCVTKIKDVDDAIRLANNSQYGLGGSLWTENIALAKEITKKINTGAIFINDMTKSDPRLPFGGINKSGYGIELSKYGIREFVNTKTIVVN